MHSYDHITRLLIANLQLEELDEIFAAKNPRKASLPKEIIALDRDVNIVNVKIAQTIRNIFSECARIGNFGSTV